MISDKDFMKAAALLKHHVPADVWDNYMGALQAYTFSQIGAVADAPLETVVLHQGFARQCKKFLMLHDECDVTKGDTP